MKKILTILISALTCILLTFSCGAEAVANTTDLTSSLNKISAWCNKNISLSAGNAESDLLVIANCEYGSDSSYKAYTADLQSYIENNKSTFDNSEWTRVILTMVSANGETVFGDTDIISLGIFNNDKIASTEDYISALVVIGEADAKPSANAINTADTLIYKLVNEQAENGSYNNDIVETANAVHALSYFTKSNENAKNALAKAESYIAEKYSAGEIDTCEELSAVIVGLTSSGVKINSDERFDGITKRLIALMNDDGSYSETNETLTAYFALAAAKNESKSSPVTMDEAAGMFGAFANMIIVLLIIFAVMLIMGAIRKLREKKGKKDE